MSATYTTKDGDVIDEIVFRYFGATAGIVEQVLELNRPISLADHGPVLPSGLVIMFPQIEAKPEQPKLTRLWE